MSCSILQRLQKKRGRNQVINRHKHPLLRTLVSTDLQKLFFGSGSRTFSSLVKKGPGIASLNNCSEH